MPAMVNVAPGADEQTMQAGARAAYAASQGARLEPYTTAVIYTGHLAARQADPLEISELVTTGPGQADVTITVADFLSGRALWLWNNIVPGEDWLDSAVLYPTSPDGVTLPPITIPRSDIVHVPEDPSVPDRSKAVRVRVSGLTQAVTSGTILLSVYVVDRFRGGLAFPDSNLICVCTRAWWKNYSTQSQNEVMIHELGHKIGLVPGGTAWRSYDRSKLDKAPHFYETSQGHVGNHCHAGIAAKPVPQKYTSHDAAASICVMYGQTNDHSAFCPDCAKAARKVDLSSGWIRF